MMFRPFGQLRCTRQRRLQPRGFTLLEAALATMIIGVGFLAVLQLIAAGTVSNRESSELTTAVNLANNINEWSVVTPYTSLRATIATGAGHTFNPPVDGRGEALSGFAGWSQVVTIKYVDRDLVTLVVPDAQTEPTSRISVAINRNGETVFSTSWIVSAGRWPPPP